MSDRVPTTEPKLYKNEQDSILLRIYEDGSAEVCWRDPLSRSWLPPVELMPHPSSHAAFVAASEETP